MHPAHLSLAVTKTIDQVQVQQLLSIFKKAESLNQSPGATDLREAVITQLTVSRDAAREAAATPGGAAALHLLGLSAFFNDKNYPSLVRAVATQSNLLDLVEPTRSLYLTLSGAWRIERVLREQLVETRHAPPVEGRSLLSLIIADPSHQGVPLETFGRAVAALRDILDAIHELTTTLYG